MATVTTSVLDAKISRSPGKIGGTMVGWKRIVVTVGEKIGKEHLTYAQGAAAEITAMAISSLGRMSRIVIDKKSCCEKP